MEWASVLEIAVLGVRCPTVKPPNNGVQPTPAPLRQVSVNFDGCRSGWWRAADARPLGGWL